MMLNLKNVLMLLPLSAALACGPMQEDASSAEPTEGTELVETTASETDPADTVSAESDDGSVSSFAIAPSCITRNIYGCDVGLTCAKITNNCAGSRRVKVIVDNGPDSPCYNLPKYGWFVHKIGFGWYQYTVTC
jgi:hypothetical protein